jgi:hypothetical protein
MKGLRSLRLVTASGSGSKTSDPVCWHPPVCVAWHVFICSNESTRSLVPAATDLSFPGCHFVSPRFSPSSCASALLAQCTLLRGRSGLLLSPCIFLHAFSSFIIRRYNLSCSYSKFVAICITPRCKHNPQWLCSGSASRRPCSLLLVLLFSLRLMLSFFVNLAFPHLRLFVLTFAHACPLSGFPGGLPAAVRSPVARAVFGGRPSGGAHREGAAAGGLRQPLLHLVSRQSRVKLGRMWLFLLTLSSKLVLRYV